MREIRRMAVEKIDLDELLREQLVARVDALAHVNERGLDRLAQDLVRERLAQRVERGGGGILQALQAEQRFGEGLQPARFDEGLAREAEQTIQMLGRYAEHAVADLAVFEAGRDGRSRWRVGRTRLRGGLGRRRGRGL